jgi:hypothetical protein
MATTVGLVTVDFSGESSSLVFVGGLVLVSGVALSSRS